MCIGGLFFNNDYKIGSVNNWGQKIYSISIQYNDQFKRVHIHGVDGNHYLLNDLNMIS